MDPDDYVAVVMLVLLTIGGAALLHTINSMLMGWP